MKFYFCTIRFKSLSLNFSRSQLYTTLECLNWHCLNYFSRGQKLAEQPKKRWKQFRGVTLPTWYTSWVPRSSKMVQGFVLCSFQTAHKHNGDNLSTMPRLLMHSEINFTPSKRYIWGTLRVYWHHWNANYTPMGVTASWTSTASVHFYH